MDQSSARELVRQARANGLGDVWVLSSKERPVVRVQRPAPEPIAPVSTPVVEEPVSQPQTIVTASQETGDVSVMSARVVNADSLSSGQSGIMRIARVEDADIKIDGRVDEADLVRDPGFRSDEGY